MGRERSQGGKVSVMGDISVASIVKCRIMTSRSLGKRAPGQRLAKAKVLGHDVHGKFEYSEEVREDSSRMML